MKPRIAIPLLLAFVATFALSAPMALAGRTWCRSDPDILLERTKVKIEVMVPTEYVALVNGPTWMRFNIPSDVDRQLVAADSGFNKLGYTVTFSTAYQPNKFDPRFAVNLMVKVPIKDATMVPIKVVVTLPDGSQVTGEGNDAKAGTTVNFTVNGTP